MTEIALAAEGLRANYGRGDVLTGIDMTVPAGEITAVVGPNGAGKTTLMLTLAGVHRRRAGSVTLFGADCGAAGARERLARGLALCPERRRIFPEMTVQENLLIGGVTLPPRRARARAAEMYERFPWLGERRAATAGNLSGGQQQILAICRALMTRPRLLLLDEPSLGLAPVAVKDVADLVRGLPAAGTAVLVVEQNVALGLHVASNCHVMAHGRFVHSGPSARIRQDKEIMSAYLG